MAGDIFLSTRDRATFKLKHQSKTYSLNFSCYQDLIQFWRKLLKILSYIIAHCLWALLPRILLLFTSHPSHLLFDLLRFMFCFKVLGHRRVGNRPGSETSSPRCPLRPGLPEEDRMHLVRTISTPHTISTSPKGPQRGCACKTTWLDREQPKYNTSNLGIQPICSVWQSCSASCHWASPAQCPLFSRSQASSTIPSFPILRHF